MRDAEVGEFPSTRFPRISPRHAWIWVRVAGTWREGYIQAWVHDRAADRWLIWGSYEDAKVRRVWEWFVYDQETIRQRHGDEPPPSDWPAQPTLRNAPADRLGGVLACTITHLLCNVVV